MCVQWRLRLAWASAQSGQSSLCAVGVANQTGRMYRVICACAGHIPLYWFCRAAAHLKNPSGQVCKTTETKRRYTVCVCVCVYTGLTSLSTIFQSYHDGVWLRQGAQCSLYSAASLKYHVPDTWHDTTPSHIILILGRPVLALPRKSECQARSS